MHALVILAHDSADAATLDRLSMADRVRFSTLDGARASAFLAGRAALLEAAARLGQAVLIDATCPDCGLAHGRPRAIGAGRSVFLSLAHADGRAVAVASCDPIGVDAEAVHTSRERIEAAASLIPGRGDALRRWTAAEAVLKADGRGLRVDPGRLTIGRRQAVFDGVRYVLRSSRRQGLRITVAQTSPVLRVSATEAASDGATRRRSRLAARPRSLPRTLRSLP